MHHFSPQLLVLAIVATLAGLFSLYSITAGPRIVGLLIFKYLRRRRIAWAALIAVTLCTMMVLVVISVMGGWLDMFEASARGLTGDLVIRSSSLAGFSGYEEMIEGAEKVPSVVAAVPTLETFGLLNIGGLKPSPARVLGIPIDRIGLVNNFPQTLYRQHEGLLERLDAIAKERKQIDRDAKKSAAQKQQELAALDRETQEINRRLKLPPTFTPPDPVKVPVTLPEEVKLSDPDKGILDTGDPQLSDKVRFQPWGAGSRTGSLVTRGPVSDADADKLRGLSDDKRWTKAVTQLARESHWPGMIASTGILEIRKNEKGETVGREEFKYHLNATLTVLGVMPNGRIDPNNRADTTYRIVDDSHTKMWQYDMDTVYVPFDRLQQDLGMGATQSTDRETGKVYTEPARTSEVHIRLKPGADVLQARDQVQQVVDNIMKRQQEERQARGDLVTVPEVRVQTWRQSGAKFIDAIEHEKVLVVFLFGIMCIVAVFLIFCIFYMIVSEKMRDIGIIKSVGATSAQVAGIFLGYGLVIGVLGAGMGLLASYLLVHNINQLHAWMGKLLHVQIWNPEVYAFDTIPNTMDPTETAFITLIAVLCSVLGAVIPAGRAAQLNPVESLRWE